ncbi:MAG TPA: four helix bundle protein [Planctomycetaceae bacterium]
MSERSSSAFESFDWLTHFRKNPEPRQSADNLLDQVRPWGANYRAACRARSAAEFRAKLGIVEEEADESGYWIELLIEAGYVDANRVRELLTEADALTATMVASIRTSRKSVAERR